MRHSDKKFLQKVQTIVEDHVSDPLFDVATFAALMQLSRMHLHRKLKSTTSLSASAYIRSYRMNLAADLLDSTELSVQDVMYQVGFRHLSYFSRCFKSHFGVPPSRFERSSQPNSP